MHKNNIYLYTLIHINIIIMIEYQLYEIILLIKNNLIVNNGW